MKEFFQILSNGQIKKRCLKVKMNLTWIGLLKHKLIFAIRFNEKKILLKYIIIFYYHAAYQECDERIRY
jgi:hypothetical protein